RYDTNAWGRERLAAWPDAARKAASTVVCDNPRFPRSFVADWAPSILLWSFQMARSFIVFGIVFAALASTAGSQTRQRESLRGLDGVYVYIQPLAKEVEAGGLSTVQIQNAVHKQLKEAGIAVQNEPKSTNGSATLVIAVSVVKQPAAEAYLF